VLRQNIYPERKTADERKRGETQEEEEDDDDDCALSYYSFYSRRVKVVYRTKLTLRELLGE
jgi:hypothetical protein